MADLRELVQDLGYIDVKSILNSGNLIFTNRNVAPQNAAIQIEEGIYSKFGISARVTVMTSEQLETVIHENPLLKIADNPSRLLVAFFSDPADLKTINPLMKKDWKPEAIALGYKVVYFWCPDGVLRSPLLKEMSHLAGDFVTTRNWATTMKIYKILKDGSPIRRS